MKLMAIDYGERRVGVASTDESGEFALPRLVLPNDANLVDKLVEFYKNEGIAKIILGESRNLDSSENPVMRYIERLKQMLEEKGIEVELHPEVLTTMEARRLQGNTHMTDASAAALILKNYIDKKKHDNNR